jgi:uncharacterized membrane protein YhhN
VNAPVLFTALAAVFAASNLACIVFFYQKPPQTFTKICIMPSLAACYALSAEEFLWTAATAALLSWIGDIFLVQKQGAPVLAGIAAFFLANLCYAASILHFSRYPVGMTALFVLPFGLALFAALIPLFPTSRVLAAVAALYGLTLAALAVCAARLFMRRWDAASAAVLAGALCLSASDTCLARRYRGKMTRASNFAVMSLYIAAQFCLLFGFARLM